MTLLEETGSTTAAPVHAVVGEIDDIAETRDALRAQARKIIGIDPDGDEGVKAPPLRPVLRELNLTLYPVTALGILSVVDNLQGYAFSVLTPEISATLGIGKGAIAGLVALKTFASAIAPLPVSASVQKKARRALLCVILAFGWSLATLVTGLVPGLGLLALVLVLDGLTSGGVSVVHTPLLLDSYPPQARVRVTSYYYAGLAVGGVVSPLLVAYLAGVLDFTWRGVFLCFGLVCLCSSIFSLRLRDPGFGKYETQRLRQAVHDLKDSPGEESLPAESVALGFFEIVRRLLLIPTVRTMLGANIVLGILTIPYDTFLIFFLADKWHLGPAGRGIFYAALSAVGTVALLLIGKRGEDLFRRDPAKLARVSGFALVAAVVLIALGAFSPYFWLMCFLFGVSGILVGALAPANTVATLSVVPAHMRPHVSALIGIAGAGAGGLVGVLFLSGINDRFGSTGAIVSLLIPGMIGSVMLVRVGRTINADIDRMIDEVVEEEETDRLVRGGTKLPLLACRGIDFSYGAVQVLFDVDFTLDDGEMVALLGVNGAGKSTLLKVVSGIGLPSSGTVRFAGRDITYLDADRRTGLGITQIPGGKAVFPGLSVVDNLRGFGHLLPRRGGLLESRMEEAFEAFPRLYERRDSMAGTLSGGEQQMLALSKALLLEPRILVIDELSLGLAPVIVAQLLEMVRRINARGTAVVLVEQSVNIALNLVERAYFMEKGTIRFEGASRDLLERGDLLRAVFLSGAAAAGT